MTDDSPVAFKRTPITEAIPTTAVDETENGDVEARGLGVPFGGDTNRDK